MKEIERFIAHKTFENCSSNTIKTYKTCLSQFLRSMGDETELNDDAIDRFLMYLYDLKIKPNSIRLKLSCIREFYKFLRKTIRPIKMKVERRLPEYLTEEEIQKLREAMGDRADYILILDILFETGMRKSEFLSLKRDSFATGEIKIIGKGDKQRIVYVSDQLLDRIRKYLSENNGKLIFDYSPATINNILNRFSKCLGKKIHPHTIRHSTASNLILKGSDILYIKEYLGHENIGTTQIYTHIKTTRDDFLKRWGGKNDKI